MHRIPKLKDQARILREAYQTKGTPLAIPESLELVARLNGFADWNAAAAAGKKAGKPRLATVPQETHYELKLVVWTVIHHHRHGLDSFQVYRDERVTDEEAIAIINSEGGGYEPEFGESFEIAGPDCCQLDVRLSDLKAHVLEKPIRGVGGESTGCLEVNLVDEFEYDTPDELPEWNWISANCSFMHKENGIEPGIWEEMVRVEKALSDDSLPDRLRPFFNKAKALKCKWVLFYQD